MKNKKYIFAIAAVLAVAVAVCLILGSTVLPTVNHGAKIAQALKPILNAENQSMQMDAEAVIGGKTITLGCKVYLVQEKDVPYLVMEQNGHSIYVTGNILLLENGKAFKIADEMRGALTEYGDLLPLISALYELLEITAEESNGETAYHIQVTGEQAQQVLMAVFPTEKKVLDEVEALQVSLVLRDETVDRIQLSASAKGVQIHGTISDFHILADGEYSVPAVVRESVASVDPERLFSLTEDLYRLVTALAPFSDMDAINGTLKLSADCGLIQLDTTMDLSELKNASNTQIDPKDLQALPEMLGWLCMESDISCTGNGDSYVYSLVLDHNSMKELSQMILPEMASYAGDLTEGSVSIILEGERITAMKVSIQGNINALITRIPITVGAEFAFE